jgi:hypothetical protein
MHRAQTKFLRHIINTYTIDNIKLLDYFKDI